MAATACLKIVICIQTRWISFFLIVYIQVKQITYPVIPTGNMALAGKNELKSDSKHLKEFT
jgi:hypothetical protein